MMSNRAVLVAVLVAFAVGLVGSLALRPAGQQRVQHIENGSADTALRIKWRVPVTVSTNVPVLGEVALHLSALARNASGGAVEMQIFNPGEIVPAFAISDAVRDGKVEAGLTWLGYDQGKTSASALLGAVPFGFQPWEYAAWWYYGGGRELAEELYSGYNIHPIYCGMTGPETAGWFREPLHSLEDLEGLKIRFAGLGGKVMERAGASVTMLPAGEIFQALEKGAIDATEFALPIADQALGFARIAKYNYYPGWHQPFTASHLVVNLDVWNSISSADQHLLGVVCAANVTRHFAYAEASQGAIIAGFPDDGVTAQQLPESLLRELHAITQEVLNEEALADESFARILASQRAFAAQYGLWKRLAYLRMDF